MASVSMDGISSLAPELQQAFQRASQAERKPLTAMENRKSDAQQRLSLMNDVIDKIGLAKETLQPLRSATAIRELSVLTSDDKSLTGIADKTMAVPGKYSFEVSRLASPPSAISNGFPDPDQTLVGTGYVTLENAAGETFEIYIDNDHASLQGVAQSINDAGIGLRATVINDQTDAQAPFRLMISGVTTGEAHNITYPEFYFVDGEQELYIDQERPATNSRVTYQGFEFETDSNEITDIIPGLSLSLKGVSEMGKPVHITVEQDVKKTSLKVKEMVDKLNGVFSFVQQQNKLDENSQTSKTLGGDYGIRLAEARLRSTLTQVSFDSFGGPFRSASDIGIQFNDKGMLLLDEKKLETAVSGHYDEVVEFLVGDGVVTGLVTRVNQTLGTLAGGPTGLLQLQKTNQSDSVRRMEREIKEKESRIEEKEQLLRQRLAKANAALETIKSQSALAANPSGFETGS